MYVDLGTLGFRGYIGVDLQPGGLAARRAGHCRTENVHILRQQQKLLIRVLCKETNYILITNLSVK